MWISKHILGWMECQGLPRCPWDQPRGVGTRFSTSMQRVPWRWTALCCDNKSYLLGVMGALESSQYDQSNCFVAKKLTISIPDGIPQFFKRCAITQDLFNFIVELCPSETSAGLANHIKRMCRTLQILFDHHSKNLTSEFHLLEHQKRFLEYLQAL